MTYHFEHFDLIPPIDRPDCWGDKLMKIFLRLNDKIDFYIKLNQDRPDFLALIDEWRHQVCAYLEIVKILGYKIDFNLDKEGIIKVFERWVYDEIV